MLFDSVIAGGEQKFGIYKMVTTLLMSAYLIKFEIGSQTYTCAIWDLKFLLQNYEIFKLSEK